MAAITEDELTRAIERTLVIRGKVPPDSARHVARVVLNYFGLDDSVLDNKVASEDRDHFYRLEEEGLLSSEEEDATVSRGKTWRIHYWLLKKDRIREVGQSRDKSPEDEAESVYRAIGDSAWSRSGSEPSGGKLPPAQ